MIRENAAQRLVPRPIPAGWALDAVLRCDEAHPGFARFLMRASSLRRQGVFLVLSQIDWGRPEVMAGWISRISDEPVNSQADSLNITAHCLLTIRVRDLVQGVYGTAPTGLVGALAKCGDDPFGDAAVYETLRAIFDDPKNKQRAALLRQATRITDNLIRVVWRLPRALLHPMVLRTIRRPEQINEYESVLKFLRRLHPHVTDEDFATSLGQMASCSSLRNWAERWIDRAACLPPELPYAGDEVIRPLLSGEDLKAAARKYKNCLRNQIPVVALGRATYFEFVGGDGAIAEVIPLSRGQWILEGVYGPQNKRAAPEAVRALRSTLEGAGVLVAAKHTHGHDLTNVAQLLNVFDCRGDWLDLEIEGEQMCA